MSDRISRDATVMATMAAGVVGYGLLVAAAEFDFGRPITVVGVGFVNLAMSWGAPLQSQFMDLLSDAERGAGFRLVRTAYMVVGASGSVVVGAVSDAAGWSVAFGLLAGVMVLGWPRCSRIDVAARVLAGCRQFTRRGQLTRRTRLQPVVFEASGSCAVSNMLFSAPSGISSRGSSSTMERCTPPRSRRRSGSSAACSSETNSCSASC